MPIQIFTDSGADLPPELAAALGIYVVPLTIHFGDQQYIDGVNLTPAEFYRKLHSVNDPPNTSQPAPGEFLSAYQKYSAPGDTIFSFHLSSKLSGTYQSAVLASRQITDRTIHVVDTESASMGIALPAIFAARWRSAGLPEAVILERCRCLIANTHIYFLVDTLEFLHRHGRIGKAQALVGSLLNIKPVLCVDNGYVAPADKVRGKTRALARLLELVCQGIQPDQQYVCAVMDADSKQTAEELVTAMRQRLPKAEYFRGSLGPTIGTHAGPGTMGIIIAALPYTG